MSEFDGWWSKSKADGVNDIFWNSYLNNFENQRIVSRGAVEHWLAQDNAQLEEGDTLVLRHGLGNLALIDPSTNSSLTKMSPKDKSEWVRLNMSNPSFKLKWLAAFSQMCPMFEKGCQVKNISEMWGDYLNEFPFEKLF